MPTMTWLNACGIRIPRAQGQYLLSRTRHRRSIRLLAWTVAFAAMTQVAFAGPMCRPRLTLTQVQFSEVQPNMERRWSAVVTVDASRCMSTAGYFTAGFLREKENAMPLEFREEFVWSTPSVLIGVDLWADEAIEISWIDSIQGCRCAR
jgi:hypothetical protein